MDEKSLRDRLLIVFESSPPPVTYYIENKNFLKMGYFQYTIPSYCKLNEHGVRLFYECEDRYIKGQCNFKLSKWFISNSSSGVSPGNFDIEYMEDSYNNEVLCSYENGGNMKISSPIIMKSKNWVYCSAQILYLINPNGNLRPKRDDTFRHKRVLRENKRRSGLDTIYE